MNTDDKTTNDQASDVASADEQSPGAEEVIELVDEVPPGDSSAEPEQALEVESEEGQDEEEPFELTDVVEESSPGPQTVDTALEGGAAGETLEPVQEKKSVELGDTAERLVSEYNKAEAEISADDLSALEPEDDDLLENLGMEISEEGPEGSPAGEAEKARDDSYEAEPESEHGSGLESKGPGVEQEPQVSVDPGALFEKISEEKLEKIIKGIVEQKVEERVERVLLEVAEAAISKEIGKIKQAL